MVPVVEVDEDEAEPSRAQHVLGRLQRLPEVGGANPKQVAKIDSGSTCVLGIERIRQVDARGEITP